MDLYCHLYIDAYLSKQGLKEHFSELLGGHSEFDSIDTDLFSLDIKKNDEHDPEQMRNPDNGFIYFPYYVDVEPQPDVDAFNYIASLQDLLRKLRSAGFRVVASCDFEDQLGEAFLK